MGEVTFWQDGFFTAETQSTREKEWSSFAWFLLCGLCVSAVNRVRSAGIKGGSGGFTGRAWPRYDPLVRLVRRLSKGIGLLVGVALLVGWVRSFSVSDELRYAWSDPQTKSIGSCSAAVSRGRLLVESHRVDTEDPS